MNRLSMLLSPSRHDADTTSCRRQTAGHRWCVSVTAIGLLWLINTAGVWAQPNTPAPPGQTSQPTGASTTATTQRQAISRPTWKELNAEQQLALKPLAPHWASLSAERKRKWLELSKNYSAMSADEQAKLQGRMTEWVTLSQQQRTQARLNYVQTQRLATDEKGSQWQAYQALSAEEKRLLRSQATGKPSGVATVKPSAGDKLIHVPITRHTPKKDEAAAALAIHRNTLLPQPAAPVEAAASAVVPATSDASAPAGETEPDKSLSAAERSSSAPTQNQ